MKLTHYILSITSVILFGCTNQEPYDCACDISDLKYNDSIVELVKKDTAFSEWQKGIYRLDPLWEADIETYRVIMIYSLTNYSHVYTVEKGEKGPRIIVQQFVAPKIDKRNSKLDKKLIFEITDNVWQRIKNKFQDNCFWSQSLNRESRQVLDGGNWYVEGFDPSKRNCANTDYHIDVCSYEQKNKLGDIVREIMKYVDQSQIKNVL